jgi:hypothetical protein
VLSTVTTLPDSLARYRLATDHQRPESFEPAGHRGHHEERLDMLLGDTLAVFSGNETARNLRTRLPPRPLYSCAEPKSCEFRVGSVGQSVRLGWSARSPSSPSAEWRCGAMRQHHTRWIAGFAATDPDRAERSNLRHYRQTLLPDDIPVSLGHV